MQFEWDEAKNAANALKHGIEFQRASQIFRGDLLSRIDRRTEYHEVREVSYGVDDEGVILAIVHTQRGDRIRIISARLASAKERQVYDDAL